jgi:hypothetical protein
MGCGRVLVMAKSGDHGGKEKSSGHLVTFNRRKRL